MTIQGAIYELNNMLSSNDIPCYWKPVIKKIIETVEQTEQDVGMCQQNVGTKSEKQTDGDLISRQAVIDIVKFECGEWVGLAKTIVKAIEQLPSAEKTAEWIDLGFKEELYGEFGKCSNCGVETLLGSNYCPNCGSRMKGVD